jgi:hypothetical protein
VHADQLVEKLATKAEGHFVNKAELAPGQLPQELLKEWYGVYRSRAVRIILLRDSHTTTGHDLELITTDLPAQPRPSSPSASRTRSRAQSLLAVDPLARP